MASNITDITSAIENLSLNFTEINTSSLLSNAIQETNNSTNGWIGIVILFIMSFTIVLHIIKNKKDFAFFDDFSIFFVSLSIILDFGLFLILWGILASYQVYIFLYCVFFCMAFFSLLTKDLLRPET